jgi:hypothetical protein
MPTIGHHNGVPRISGGQVASQQASPNQALLFTSPARASRSVPPCLPPPACAIGCLAGTQHILSGEAAPGQAHPDQHTLPHHTDTLAPPLTHLDCLPLCSPDRWPRWAAATMHTARQATKWSAPTASTRTLYLRLALVSVAPLLTHFFPPR